MAVSTSIWAMAGRSMTFQTIASRSLGASCDIPSRIPRKRGPASVRIVSFFVFAKRIPSTLYREIKHQRMDNWMWIRRLVPCCDLNKSQSLRHLRKVSALVRNLTTEMEPRMRMWMLGEEAGQDACPIEAEKHVTFESWLTRSGNVVWSRLE